MPKSSDEILPAPAAQTTPAQTISTIRDYTPARVALTRAGISIATSHALDFSLAYAQARDAVHSALDVPALLSALRERILPAIAAQSAATVRAEYLRRPDLGRTLTPTSTAQLTTEPGAPSMQSHRMGGLSFAEANDQPSPTPPTTLTIILADGLSASATQTHAIPLLDALLPLLDESWRLTPIVVATQARVALADPIGQTLRADASLILIGERPGLSSPDSLGAYLTWAPRPGRTDAERNCISNIRPQAGLDYETAAHKIAALLHEARSLGLTGVQLREPDMVAISVPVHRDRLE
jgi:ethanolamine ammonia-lyase small subunit